MSLHPLRSVRLHTAARRRGAWLLPAALAAAAQAAGAAPRAPETRQDNVRETLHGVEVVDPYRWLEDQQSPETRAWIDAQNGHTQSVLGSLPGRKALQQRLGELLKVDAMSAPLVRGGSYFFTRRRADQDLAVIYRRKGASGSDEMLIDPHGLSADRTTSVLIRGVSRDGTLMAYGVREGGADETTVQFMEVDAHRELPDRLPKGRYFSVSIKPDKSGFYYTTHSAQGPRVRYHAMGADPAADREIFGSGYGAGYIIGAALSQDGKTLVIEASAGSSADKSEVWVQDLERGGPIVPIVNDVDARFDAQIAGDSLFMLTNWNAPNGRVLKVDLKNPARDRWQEIIPQGKGSIQSYSLAGGRVFVDYLEEVRSRVAVFSPEGRHERDIPLPALGSVSGVSGEWDSPEAFYSFTSFNTPTTVYRYDAATAGQTIWSRPNVPIDPDRFEVKQVWFTSKDGTRVPMFLMHRKGLKLDGARPTYLTAYGGFNNSLTPVFSSTGVVWAEAGGVWAVPNLRGGGEFGEAWHKAGMREKKQNVFDDFYAAAEWLIANKYTKSSKLACSGGSNGGLLVGAALTQRPELFRAVVCSYPLLDMVRYHRFLVARFWIPEYGSSEDPEQFRYLHAYSPYHRVKKGTKYPAVLMVTGDADTRVAPLHGRKMAALLQSATGSDRPALLHYDTKAGHSGGKPIAKTIEDVAQTLQFLFWQLDVEYPPASKQR